MLLGGTPEAVDGVAGSCGAVPPVVITKVVSNLVENQAYNFLPGGAGKIGNAKSRLVLGFHGDGFAHLRVQATPAPGTALPSNLLIGLRPHDSAGDTVVAVKPDSSGMAKLRVLSDSLISDYRLVAGLDGSGGPLDQHLQGSEITTVAGEQQPWTITVVSQEAWITALGITTLGAVPFAAVCQAADIGIGWLVPMHFLNNTVTLPSESRKSTMTVDVNERLEYARMG